MHAVTRHPGRLHLGEGARMVVAGSIARRIEQCFEGNNAGLELPLCPGCTAILLFDTLTLLSQRHGFNTYRVFAHLGAVLSKAAVVIAEEEDHHDVAEELRHSFAEVAHARSAA